MATITRDQLLTRKYADPKYYPYGFSRSGDFSIRESQLLSDYGSLIAALLTGQIQPENDVDQRLLAVARGEQTPETATERVWCKYQQRIHRPRCGSIYGSRKADTAVEADDCEQDDDEAIVMTLDR